MVGDDLKHLKADAALGRIVAQPPPSPDLRVEPMSETALRVYLRGTLSAHDSVEAERLLDAALAAKGGQG